MTPRSTRFRRLRLPTIPTVPAILPFLGAQPLPAAAADTRPLERHPMHTLELDHGTLAYDDQGSGPLVVMAPGLGDLRQQYRFLVPALVEAGYRVITVDLRGHGGSSTGWPSYTTASAGADLIALVEHVDAGPAVLVGNSFAGGAVAHAAADRPDLVSGIVMIAPFVREAKIGAGMKLAMKVLMSGPWKVRAWDAYYGSLYKTRQPEDLASYRKNLRANLAEPGRFAAVKAMMFRTEPDVADRFSELIADGIPTLVVMGTADPDFPDATAEARWIAEHTQGEVHLVEGAGHYSHAEVPGQTAPAIEDFVARVSRGA